MLQLDDTFRVVVDSSCQNYILEKLSPVIDKKTREVVREDWTFCGFHGNSMRSVLLQYKNEAVINDDTLDNIHKIFDKLVEIDKTIIRVVKKENFKLVAKKDD